MDKKRTLKYVLVAVAMMSIWFAARELGYLPKPEPFAPQTATVPTPPADTQPSATQPIASATQNVAATQPAGATQPVAAPPVMSAGPANGLTVAPAAPEAAKIAELGSATLDDPSYVMQLRTSPIGGGIEDITLNEFRKSEDFKKDPKERGVYVFQQPYPNYGFSRSLATRSVTIDGQIVDLSSATWTLKSQGENERTLLAPGQPENKVTLKGPSATYSTIVMRNGQPALELTKTFTLFGKASPTKGYEVTVDFQMRNLSSGEINVTSVINGPTLPPREAARPPDRQVLAGYRMPDNSIHFPTPIAVEQFTEGVRTFDLTKDTKYGHPLAWAGVSSVYFNAFVLFEQPTEIAKVAAEVKDIEDTTKGPEDRPILMTFETVPSKLAAGETKGMSMSAFFGPRWRNVLTEPFYAGATRDYDQTLVVKSGPCGDCAFDWLINGLVGMLKGFHWLAGGFVDDKYGDWGIAIILLVALVRTLLHPITKRSQVHMMKMGKMGPEIAKLKEKYGDDKEAIAKAQMTLMKEHGLGPLLGCLPIFLQMPIWIALWQALQSTFELRQAPFLWHYTWIEDLSKPDYLIHFTKGGEWHLPFGMVIDGLNLLPLLLAVVFHVQARIQNSLSVATTPEQESQKKMMMWMSTLLFPLFLYNGPSGLNLYILTSTFVGMIESKVIRDHIKQKEAAEKLAGPVIVDVPPTRAARKNRDGKVVEPAVKKTGIAGWLQRIQDRVEEIQREKDKANRGGK